MKISKHWKAVLAVLVAGVVAGEAVVTDLIITPDEWITIGIALLTAAGVWLVPNRQGDGGTTKTPGYRGQHGDTW